MSSAQFEDTYAYTNLLFGEIYSVGGVPNSAYFQSIDPDRQMLGINFVQNFPGVGLPDTLFGNFSQLI